MLRALAISLVLFGGAACTYMPWNWFSAPKNKISLQQTAVAPAASAKAVVFRDKNQNAVVDLKVKDLAPPSDLRPPKQAYAVWAENQEGTVYLLGRLDVNKKGKGKLVSTVPMKNFRIVVTAEQVVKEQVPSKEVVLSSNYITAPRR